MWLQLPEAVVIALNVGLWPVIHMGASIAGVRSPAHWFSPGAGWFRPARWERQGRTYEQWFAVRLWKRHLPDGATLLRGAFAKKHLESRDPAYLAAFAIETCRGEAVHWATFVCAPVFFLWNPDWAGWVMVGYATVANVPCIIAQRYNRARLLRALPVSD
jgi:glycosyl-4,4'-diaponeurosporenoate acyltransferase